MVETTIVNRFGKLAGWNSVTVTLLGRDLQGITELSYEDSVTKENVYGAGKYPVGRAEKNYEPKASISILKEELDGLQKSLPLGVRIQDILPFDIDIQYETLPGFITKDRIRNAEFTNRGITVKNGDGSISVKLDLVVSEILYSLV